MKKYLEIDRVGMTFEKRYEADAGRVSATILLTTALAFVTFSSLVWLMGVGRNP